MTGGIEGDNKPLDTTEILRDGIFSTWQFLPEGKLPLAINYAKISKIENVLYLIGGQTRHTENSRDLTSEILAWDGEAERWEPAGNMLEPRAAHAVLAVSNAEQFFKKGENKNLFFNI